MLEMSCCKFYVVAYTFNVFDLTQSLDTFHITKWTYCLFCDKIVYSPAALDRYALSE